MHPSLDLPHVDSPKGMRHTGVRVGLAHPSALHDARGPAARRRRASCGSPADVIPPGALERCGTTARRPASARGSRPRAKHEIPERRNSLPASSRNSETRFP